ncbi:MAG: hypothetical protein K2G64_01505 [Muribaculaceae bacterium]|nr:hypothetical protein [Muribaculaceae bacterium]MDE5967756.1 hypothetical protein [Muribaculaceae bacterium]
MKKFFFAAAFALALCTVSCSSNSPEAQAEKMIKEATEQMKKANSLEEVQQIGEDFAKKAEELDEKYPDAKLEDSKELQEAVKEFQQAAMETAIRLSAK